MSKILFFLFGSLAFLGVRKTTTEIFVDTEPSLVDTYRSIDEAIIQNSSSPALYIDTDFIDLSDQNLSALPDRIFKYINLKSIDLSGNKFKSFPYRLFEFRQLEYIDITDGVFMVFDELNALLEEDAFLIELNTKAHGLNDLGIRFSDSELLVLNSTGKERCDTPQEFYEVMDPYEPELVVNMIRYRGDEVYFSDEIKRKLPEKEFFNNFASSNLKIYRLNNGVTARDLCQFDEIGQRFSLEKERIEELGPFENYLKESDWFKLGTTPGEAMWINYQWIWETKGGNKIISMSKGGC